MIKRRERARLRKVLKSDYGALVALARELGVTHQAISNWFAMRCESQRIADAVVARCEQIQAAQEQQTAA